MDSKFAVLSLYSWLDLSTKVGRTDIALAWRGSVKLAIHRDCCLELIYMGSREVRCWRSPDRKLRGRVAHGAERKAAILTQENEQMCQYYMLRVWRLCCLLSWDGTLLRYKYLQRAVARLTSVLRG